MYGMSASADQIAVARARAASRAGEARAHAFRCALAHDGLHSAAKRPTVAGLHHGEHFIDLGLQVAQRCTAIGTPCSSALAQLVGAESAKRSPPRAAGRRCSSRFDFAGRGIEAPLRLRRPRGLRDAMAHGRHLGEDRHRDLGRRLRADVQPHGTAQARDSSAETSNSFSRSRRASLFFFEPIAPT